MKKEWMTILSVGVLGFASYLGKAKCDWLMRQAGLWCKLPGNKPTAEALALWIAHLSC
jgi:hypothetical protein